MWIPLAFAAPSSSPPADAFQRGIEVEQRHMQILGTWALGNLAVGTAGALVAEDPRLRSFHGTNAAWNTVNLAIAGVGLLGTRARRRQPTPSPEDVAKGHRNLRTALAVNLGLDVVYMGAGVGLMASDGETWGVDHRGAGAGLLLQGAFLATFDAAFLLAHRSAEGPRVALRPLPTEQGAGLALTWTAR